MLLNNIALLLSATAQKLKKNAQSCKKRKKEAAEEIAKLESDLKSRHEEELYALRNLNRTSTYGEVSIAFYSIYFSTTLKYILFG